MVVSLFTQVDNDSPAKVLAIGERVFVGNHVAKVIDRVCPHCYRLGPPFPPHFEIAGGDFKGLRWCPEHRYLTPQRFACVND